MAKIEILLPSEFAKIEILLPSEFAKIECLLYARNVFSTIALPSRGKNPGFICHCHLSLPPHSPTNYYIIMSLFTKVSFFQSQALGDEEEMSDLSAGPCRTAGSEQSQVTTCSFTTQARVQNLTQVRQKLAKSETNAHLRAVKVSYNRSRYVFIIFAAPPTAPPPFPHF